jgi:hypothetical protein
MPVFQISFAPAKLRLVRERVRRLLWWFDGGTCLFDAALDEFRLHFGFLSNQQVDFRLESLITRQFDLDPVLSRTDQQGTKLPTKLAGMSNEFVIEKYSRAPWLNVQLQRSGDIRRLRAGAELHTYSNGLGLSGLNPKGTPKDRRLRGTRSFLLH